ncbi:hypothetical protein FX016_18320 [Cupriavidus gilardii]|nr:hypothetical protein FX016_18320 [Cupriavidus gilardii]
MQGLRRIPFHQLVVAALATCTAVALATWAYVVVGHARYFDGYFANGAFQILNPMRRLADGQIPGKDFMVFHGIGTVWLHYPLYVVFGKDLAASEISRFVVSALLHGLACIWLWAVIRREGKSSALSLGLLFFVAAAFALDRVFFPQNSLLGTRSIFPIYLAIAMIGNPGAMRLALLAAAALIVSPEHGIASMAGLTACACLSIFHRDARSTSIKYAVSVGLACLTYYGVMWFASSGAVVANLEYALHDVPADQFWYFGVRPNAYLPTDWASLLFWRFYVFAGLWVAGLIVSYLLYRSKSVFAMASIYLFVYATFGTVSQFGYLSHVNLQGSERALILICVLGTANLRSARATDTFSLFALLGLGMLGYAGREAIAYAFPDRPIGDKFLSPYWQQHLDEIDRLSPDQPIWSIYAGLPEAIRGEFAPSFDYIIHALGPKGRQRYVATFDSVKPNVVRLDNAKRWGYGWWLINSDWEFFRRVFLSYELTYEDRMSTLWTRATKNSSHADRATITKTGDLCFIAKDATGAGGIFSLRVAYSLNNPWARLPIVGQTPRQIISSERRNDYGVSLPPPNVYGGRWDIPLVLRPHETVEMCAGVETFLPGVSMTLDKVEVSTVPVTDSARQYLLELWK